MEEKTLDIYAKITGITYTPFLCRKLNIYPFNQIDIAISKDACFLLKIDEGNTIAVSWWVSPKRTRSYPYARVYDSLANTGKRVTIIPIIKDEGSDGDRDYIQWDTISLMSLLGVYVIIAYYKTAIKSKNYENKITEQRFDYDYVKEKIRELLSYQSDALHWNLAQTDLIGDIGKRAIESYEKISQVLRISLHSKKDSEDRIKALMKSRQDFMQTSRTLAQEAQLRESKTIQPKENLRELKGKITIKNYLGGLYYFTADEAEINGDTISLIEGKHTKNGKLPSRDDIVDGLVKMILFSNLQEITIGRNSTQFYKKKPILKLTSNQPITPTGEIIQKLKKEAQTNSFQIEINGTFL